MLRPKRIFTFYSAGHHEDAEIRNQEWPGYSEESMASFKVANEQTAQALARSLFDKCTLDTTRALVRDLVEQARLESGDIFNPQR